MTEAAINDDVAAGADALAVLCTCPDEATARALATGLVERRLAACVNILPQIRSIYRWQGETHEDGETLLIAKTTRRACAALQSWLVQQHPYDVPEVLALPVAAGSPDYLAWIRDETDTT